MSLELINLRPLILNHRSFKYIQVLKYFVHNQGRRLVELNREWDAMIYWLVDC